MSNEETTTTRTPAGDAYPPDLARFVLDHWTRDPAVLPNGQAPENATLTQFYSACYQASLLRDEERSVTFRAILAPPELFAPDGLPPESLQRFAFCHSFPLGASELRRLSVAADTQRTLIGVQQHADGSLRIWGVVSSGAHWLRDVRGGRRAGAPLPAVPVVHVDAPGSVAAYKGLDLIAVLHSGRISGSRVDPFTSAWLPERFADFGDELVAHHLRARRESGQRWAPLHPRLPREVSDRMMKRVIALLREARHGGTIVFVPNESVGELDTVDPFIDLKYRFRAASTQRSYADLIVSILSRLATIHGADPRGHEPVGWREFESTADAELTRLDEAVFETAHLIAALASADGAVVLNKQHDLLGFGGMIAGRLPAVRSVARALDLEGDIVAAVGTENVGARHRSAYRLAGAIPGVVAIVISQDGGVQFVAQKNGRVTCWEQE
jgi:hypothetical protein